MQLPYISGGCRLWVKKYANHKVDLGSLSTLAFPMILSNLIHFFPYLWKDITLFQRIKYTF